MRGGIFTGKRCELGGSGENQGLIVGFVVSGSVRAGAGLRGDLRAAVQKFDDVGHVKNVLIESRKEKCLITLERASDRASELLPAVMWFEGEEWQ